MAMLHISIPIPAERITYKKVSPGKPRRIYHVEKRYRNAYGPPTAKEMAIGKEDPNVWLECSPMTVLRNSIPCPMISSP